MKVNVQNKVRAYTFKLHPFPIYCELCNSSTELLFVILGHRDVCIKCFVEQEVFLLETLEENVNNVLCAL